MTHADIAHQQPLLGMISRDAITAVMQSYQAHRQSGDSELAAHQAALNVFLDHVRTQPLWTAAKAVRMIILQASAGIDRPMHHGDAKAIAVQRASSGVRESELVLRPGGGDCIRLG